MRSISLFILAAFSIALSSCRQDKTPAQPATVNLTFRGHFDDAPLLMYERAYPYESGMDVKFQLFHFYLADVVLLPEDSDKGEEIRIRDIDLVSFKDVQSEEAAQRGVTVSAAEVPPGRYRGIRFGIGVSPELNATQPGDYAPGHPLTGNYWSWATGYVFFKIEGNADPDGDGQFDEKLTFHIGLNDNYRTPVFERPIEIKGGETTDLRFDIDLHQVLAPSPDDFVDFRQVTQDHTNDLELAKFLSDNLKEAIQLVDIK